MKSCNKKLNLKCFTSISFCYIHLFASLYLCRSLVVLWNILYLPNNTVVKCIHLEFVYKLWNTMNSSKLHWNGKNNILKLWVLNARNEINALKWMKEHEKFYLLNTTTEWNSSLIVHLVEIRQVFFGFYARISLKCLRLQKMDVLFIVCRFLLVK